MTDIINFELRENAPKNYHNACVGIYLHGELENIAGFDLTYSSIDPKTIEEGIHQVTYNNSIEATLFLWKVRVKGFESKCNGLIVKNDDKENIHDANYKYIIKQTII